MKAEAVLAVEFHTCREAARFGCYAVSFVSFCSGASEMLMANAVSKLAARTPGKESVAIEAYAKALRMVLIDN